MKNITGILFSKGPNPIINLSVESEKSFQFSDELGWNWHKSWKLPTVSVQLEVFLILL